MRPPICFGAGAGSGTGHPRDPDPARALQFYKNTARGASICYGTAALMSCTFCAQIHCKI